jgi:hypothetical protein
MPHTTHRLAVLPPLAGELPTDEAGIVGTLQWFLVGDLRIIDRHANLPSQGENGCVKPFL